MDHATEFSRFSAGVFVRGLSLGVFVLHSIWGVSYSLPNFVSVHEVPLFQILFIASIVTVHVNRGPFFVSLTVEVKSIAVRNFFGSPSSMIRKAVSISCSKTRL